MHFTAPDYDFTIYGARAHDRPTKFTIDDYFGPTKIMIPQYNYRIGYHITRRWAVSMGLDHMKYVLDHNQSLKISGIVRASASTEYVGTSLNEQIFWEKLGAIGFNFHFRKKSHAKAPRRQG